MLHREALSYRADPKSHHTRPQEPATGGIPQQHPDDIGREVKVEMSENVNAGRIEAERKHLRAESSRLRTEFPPAAHAGERRLMPSARHGFRWDDKLDRLVRGGLSLTIIATGLAAPLRP